MQEGRSGGEFHPCIFALRRMHMRLPFGLGRGLPGSNVISGPSASSRRPRFPPPDPDPGQKSCLYDALPTSSQITRRYTVSKQNRDRIVAALQFHVTVPCSIQARGCRIFLGVSGRVVFCLASRQPISNLNLKGWTMGGGLVIAITPEEPRLINVRGGGQEVKK